MGTEDRSYIYVTEEALLHFEAAITAHMKVYDDFLQETCNRLSAPVRDNRGSETPPPSPLLAAKTPPPSNTFTIPPPLGTTLPSPLQQQQSRRPLQIDDRRRSRRLRNWRFSTGLKKKIATTANCRSKSPQSSPLFHQKPPEAQSSSSTVAGDENHVKRKEATNLLSAAGGGIKHCRLLRSSPNSTTVDQFRGSSNHHSPVTSISNHRPPYRVCRFNHCVKPPRQPPDLSNATPDLELVLESRPLPHLRHRRSRKKHQFLCSTKKNRARRGRYSHCHKKNFRRRSDSTNADSKVVKQTTSTAGGGINRCCLISKTVFHRSRPSETFITKLIRGGGGEIDEDDDGGVVFFVLTATVGAMQAAACVWSKKLNHILQSKPSSSIDKKPNL